MALHPGTTVEEAREATGWDPKAAEEPGITHPPAQRELEVLRDLRARTGASREEA